MITKDEIAALDAVNTPHGKWWVPFVWAANLIKQARKEGRINDDYLMKTVLDEIMVYRGQLGNLYSYDWISVPLVYTQVTTLAVYTFFVGSIFARQFLEPSQGYAGHEIDLYVPVFTVLQFFFYMGWLKVAEQLINPFGEDDDDFNTNWVLDRNMQISLLVVDDLYGSTPSVERDLYFGEAPPEYLPYTKSSINTHKTPYMGSTADLSVSNAGMQVVNPMETIVEGQTLNIGQSVQNFATVQNSPYVGSPVGSPGKSRRVQNIMINNLRKAFDGSKPLDTMDGIRVGSLEKDLKLNQQFNGVGLCSRSSYLEDWLSEHETALGNGNLSKSPTITDAKTLSVPQTPSGEPESMFSMELDEDMNPTQKTANHDLKVHLMGLGFLNRDLERVRQSHVMSEGLKNNSMGPGTSENGEEYVSTPEVFNGLYKVPEDKVLPSQTIGHSGQPLKEVPIRVEVDTDKSAKHQKPVTKVVKTDDDIPQVVVDSQTTRNRHLSETSHTSSSCSSLPSYTSHESHQNTVTSITPLLTASESTPNVRV